MSLTVQQQETIIKLYSNVVTVRGDVAYDAQGNEVSYNLALVTAQALKDNCKAQAKILLAKTDWAVLPDVGLANSAEYVTYRAALRGLVLTPVENPTFPTEPTPVWSN